jgi:hypothetical protein
MRKWLVAGISAFVATSGLLAATLVPAKAGDRMEKADYNVTPFELVSLARQGTLSDEGIPSYAALNSRFHQGELHAKDLVEAAVETGRLADAAMNDEEYLASVEMQLESLERPSDND